MNGEMDTAALGEADYTELLNCILSCLEKVSAKQIIEQINELGTISVIEKKKTQRGRSAAKHAPYPHQLSYFDQVDGEKTARDDVSESVSRHMTNGEIYHAAVNMLSSYLLSVPAMVTTVKESLAETETQKPSILWKTEGSSLMDKPDKTISIDFFDVPEDETLGQIKRKLTIMKDA